MVHQPDDSPADAELPDDPEHLQDAEARGNRFGHVVPDHRESIHDDRDDQTEADALGDA